MMKSEYNYRRRVILDGVRDMGLDCFEPRGAFYIFPSIQRTGMTSNEFCNKIIYSFSIFIRSVSKMFFIKSNFAYLYLKF